ncbi:MAG: hypothetical protein GY807_04055 [Gammaproteobacteria bacterium]|nr:hypothetical protein [Gammaproteobacteria bacterium]
MSTDAHWRHFYAAVPVTAQQEIAKDIEEGPLRVYMTMLQVAYSFMQGNEADYDRLPPFIHMLWTTKSQFHDV